MDQAKDKFDANIVEDIYMQDIRGSKYVYTRNLLSYIKIKKNFFSFSIRRIMVLEFSQYLENYLWPHYKPDASYQHMLSIVNMVNEKFRERVQVWHVFRKYSTYFPDFFQQVLRGLLEDQLIINLTEQTALLVFLNHCFNSMEENLCRDQVKRLVSLSMWLSLQPERREHEFKKNPRWRKYWKAIQKKDKPEEVEKLTWERTFLHRLMLKFMTILDTITEDGICPLDIIHYCERFIELVTDLEALLPTRRFFNTVLDDCHLVVRCQLSALIKRPEGHLFRQVSFFLSIARNKFTHYLKCFLFLTKSSF